ncbi:MAG: tRNA (adenosine(37)-N6)-dimethylallyltransferase MiaA [Bacteroidota bacterium]|nr:tRNA (adenosine(37)-N6)-dimethylallyltransferase MiaA [Bacteroidota bacterium]MDP3145453.1 tRNA (adenosine(37)-N6)-dimethylallyltransferase MiaA [Bacteroidota bacterium]
MTGPTAVGKTAIAINLAKIYDTVILSADSRQFYKELTIGTAKPTNEELSAVKHYFINTKSISELYGAGHFEKDALATLNELFKTKNIVFLVGGSGLYINALINGVDDFIEVPIEIRDELNKKFELNGLEWLQNEVKTLDETYFNSVDTHNPQRLIRALEVCQYTGKPYSSFLNQPKAERNFKVIKILINTNREQLYSQINNRVDKMMASGLLEEVKQLANQKHLNALKTVGYKELYAYLDASYNLNTAIDKIKQHSRNYAKRQLTWFKNQDKFEEFEPTELEKIQSYINSIVLKNNGN